jgi:hypothetical protein
MAMLRILGDAADSPHGHYPGMHSLTTDALRAAIGGVVLVALFSFFFVYPGHDPEPNGVPLGLVGPGAERTGAELERDGRFEPKRYDDAEAARAAILDREVYGAVVTGAQPRLLVAGAASPQVASILEEAAARTPGAAKPPVEDVRPLDADDPRGSSINLLSVPLSVTSILGAMLLFTMAPALPPGRRLAVLACFAVAGGLVAMLIVRVAIGALPGPFLGLTALAALAIAAMAFAAAGIMSAVGPSGIMLSFLIFLMLGNPASGAATAPELLPDPWRDGGQLLPAGAAATGLRNTAYFDGAALAQPLIVLAAFTAAGALLLVATAPRATRSSTRPAHGQA